MAIQMATYLSGKMGNVVFYTRNGTHIARSLPDKVRLSANTKKCNSNFAMASACGKVFRGLLAPVLPFPKDLHIQRTFSGAFTKWLRGNTMANLQACTPVPFINDFQFNEATSLAARWKLALTVTQPAANLIEVYLPDFVPTATVVAPALTVSVECTLIAASCQLTNAGQPASSTETIFIPFNDTPISATTISLQVNTAAGSIFITAVSLKYLMANGSYCSRPAFLPAAVIGSGFAGF